jgi:hypothetical protein
MLQEQYVDWPGRDVCNLLIFFVAPDINSGLPASADSMPCECRFILRLDPGAPRTSAWQPHKRKHVGRDCRAFGQKHGRAFVLLKNIVDRKDRVASIPEKFSDRRLSDLPDLEFFCEAVHW